MSFGSPFFLHEVEPSTGVETVDLVPANDNVRTDFYVYAWLRPSGEPFYIGKGCGKRDKAPKYHNPIFGRIVAKIEREGGEPIVVRLHDGLTEEESHRLESEEIKRHGRINLRTGTLANLTDGGEGNSGWVMPDATKAKIGAIHKGRVQTAEHRAKRLLSLRNPTEETRAKMRAAQIGRKHGDEALIKMSANNAMHRPEIRAKVSAILSGRPKSEEHKAKLSIAAGNRSAEHLAAISAANRMRPPASGYKGVSFNKQLGKWKVAIRVGDKRPFLGYFADPIEAAIVYDKAAIAAWGTGNCYVNFPAANDNAVAALVAA